MTVTQRVSKVRVAFKQSFAKLPVMDMHNDSPQIQRARTRLQAHKGWWTHLAPHIGVSYSWLYKFAGGHIPNPRVRTLERLNAFLDRLDRLSRAEQLAVLTERRQWERRAVVARRRPSRGDKSHERG